MAGFFENLGAKNAQRMFLEENFILPSNINLTKITNMIKSQNIYITNVNSQEKSFELQLDDIASNTATTVFIVEDYRFFHFKMGAGYEFSEQNLSKALAISNKINSSYFFVNSSVIYDEKNLGIIFTHNFSYNHGIIIHQLVDVIKKFRVSGTEAYVNEVAPQFS